MMQRSISKVESWYILGVVALALFGFFYNLGIYPFFLEEPRRAMIAFEMVVNDNYWVPTVMGDFYYKKPPFYNWLVLVGYQVFGYHELAPRVISLMSHLAMTSILFLFAKKWFSFKTALYVGVAYLLSVDILFYFSTLGEIDLFYTLVTSSMIMVIYHFGEKRQYWRLFLLVYLLAAIGLLTKGLTSLPYAAISLLVYFVIKKRFKVLFSPAHMVGILFFVLLIGGYFWKYAQYAPVTDWWTFLYSESADKATKGSFLQFVKHIFSFPLIIIAVACPASVLVPFYFKRKNLVTLRQHPLIWFCLMVFFFNFVIYWVSVDAETRYVYPIMPFLIMAMISFMDHTSIDTRGMRTGGYISVALVSLALIASFFIPGLESVKLLNITLVVLLGLVGGLFYLLVKRVVNPFLIIFGLLVVLKIGLSAIVPVTRKYDSGTARDVERGKEIARITQGTPIYRYGDVQFHLTAAFYIQRDKMSILKSVNHFDEQYYIVREEDLPDESTYRVLRQVPYDAEKVFLIEMLR